MENVSKTLFADIKTKERSVNFTTAEIDQLQSLIDKYKHILFCKTTDAVSSKQKDSVWISIQKGLNALGDTPRTMKQLKYKFENMKRDGRKEASNERQSLIRTGGGRPPLPSESGDTVDWLRALIPTSIDGNKAIYDDDVITEPPKALIPLDITIEIKDTEENDLMNKTSEMEFTPLNGEPIAIASGPKQEFDASTPYSSLRRPVPSPLKRQAKKLKNCNLIRQKLQEKKISILDSLQDSIRHAQELHEQKLRHNEERHQLEIEKCSLEILNLTHIPK